MQTFVHASRWGFIRRKALEAGQVERQRYFSRPHVLWDIAGNCEHPVHREISMARASRPDEGRDMLRGRFEYARERCYRETIEYTVRCRKCPSCLKTRAHQWRIRATGEIKRSSRTWFGTMTLRPEEQSRAEYATRLRLDRAGVRFDALSQAEQLQEIVKTSGREVTLWLKRVRKQSGAALRYMLVVERHKSPDEYRRLGQPVPANAGKIHYHCLIHELDEFRPVRHAVLTTQWKLGFTNFKLVDSDNQKVAGYVAKYLAKSIVARVRASKGYGLDSEMLRAIHIAKGGTTESVKPYDLPPTNVEGRLLNVQGISNRQEGTDRARGWRPTARLSDAVGAGNCSTGPCGPCDPDPSEDNGYIPPIIKEGDYRGLWAQACDCPTCRGSGNYGPPPARPSG